jgi:uncharacterized phage-associated protein
MNTPKTNVFDVAVYILKKTGPISAMKLQKLVYYSQAWSLVWDDAALFNEKIEAWTSGPVVRELYERHRGQFVVSEEIFRGFISGEKFSKEQKETIDIVLRSYADKSAQWLSDQTHSEEPWKIAREGLPDTERGSKEITLESMSEYYSSLL